MKQKEIKTLSLKGSARNTESHSTTLRNNKIFITLIFLIYFVINFDLYSKIETPTLPPPSPCVGCQNLYWYSIPLNFTYKCPYSTNCYMVVTFEIALGCATCEVWIDSISEPTNCSCSGSYDYNLEFKAAVAAILNYMSTPPTLCQSTIHIYTSTCWITSEPIIVGIGANGQPITMEFTTPCGENCCKNTYDLTTVPPTYLGTIVYNNGIDTCFPVWGIRKSNVCYKIECEDFIPYARLKDKRLTQTK